LIWISDPGCSSFWISLPIVYGRSGEAKEQCRSNSGDDSAHDNYTPQFA
jgi:hypothetical protein